MQDRKDTLALLLQGYFSKETTAEILETKPDLIKTAYSSLEEQKVGGIALYSVGAVAKELIDDLGRKEKVNFRMLANALVEKFSVS